MKLRYNEQCTLFWLLLYALYMERLYTYCDVFWAVTVNIIYGFSRYGIWRVSWAITVSIIYRYFG